MARSPFALFVDVMGVQQQLLPLDKNPEGSKRFNDCRAHLEDFHNDLDRTIGQDLPLLLAGARSIPQPSFIAEFSDSAYIVGDRFASVAIPGILLMRRALRHEYPLRGGIGVGSFSHEISGVHTGRDRQVWSTSSFLGSAVVTAYRAERGSALGLRIFVHHHVMRRNTEAFLKPYTMPLPSEEVADDCSHELRLWRSVEVHQARERLAAFRDKQDLSERARRHYDATDSAYERFEGTEKDLPHIPPAIWL